MAEFQPLSDPDQITAHLRLLKIYRRQRKEAGVANTSVEDLKQEIDILGRLTATEN